MGVCIVKIYWISYKFVDTHCILYVLRVVHHGRLKERVSWPWMYWTSAVLFRRNATRSIIIDQYNVMEVSSSWHRELHNNVPRSWQLFVNVTIFWLIRKTSFKYECVLSCILTLPYTHYIEISVIRILAINIGVLCTSTFLGNQIQIHNLLNETRHNSRIYTSTLDYILYLYSSEYKICMVCIE